MEKSDDIDIATKNPFIYKMNGNISVNELKENLEKIIFFQFCCKY